MAEIMTKWVYRKNDIEGYRAYNREKQQEYRDKKRGKPARIYINVSRTEIILKSEGHCSFCGMLLASDYHKLHPLVGCIKFSKRK